MGAPLRLPCYVTYVTCLQGSSVSIGTSGRVVIEIDPVLKRELHSVLARRGMTLKDWFLSKADDCISSEARTANANPRAATSQPARKGRRSAS